MAAYAIRELALVLASTNELRERGCERLSRAGYDVLGFSDSTDVEAWLEEETPVFAIIASSIEFGYKQVVTTLLERDVYLSLLLD